MTSKTSTSAPGPLSAPDDPRSLDAGGRAATVAPEDLAPGPVLVTIPHSDDEILGAGGLLAHLARAGTEVHFVYATDGRLSPSAPGGGPLPEADRLVAERRDEARAAVARIGLDTGRMHFLDLPDGTLGEREDDLRSRIGALLSETGARTVLAPFRYDQHPDHLALGRAVRRLVTEAGAAAPRLLEYFVYWQYPLAAVTDIRRAVSVRHLAAVDIAGVAADKRAALDCYASQVTPWADHQTRPILSGELLDKASAGPEYFATAAPDVPLGRLFHRPSLRLRFNLRYGGRIVFLKKRWIG